MPQSQDGETFRPDVTILPGPQAAPVRQSPRPASVPR